MRSNQDTLAFTLIEVLIVVAIISLLTIISIGVYLKQLAKGYDARRKTDMAQIRVALEEFEKDHNCYPTNITCKKGDNYEVLKSYIPYIPCDPRTKEDYTYTYQEGSTCPKWYWLFTSLENESDPKIDEVGCSGGCIKGNYFVASANAPTPEKIVASPSPTPEMPPSTSAPTPRPTSPPFTDDHHYGCFDGTCFPLSLGGAHCSPNYNYAPNCNGNCLDQFGKPQNECNPD